MIQTNKLIDTSDNTWKEILENMQGNIVKHHGRHHAYHIFFQFDKSKKSEIKNWIKIFGPTTSKQQLDDTKKYNELSKKENKSNEEIKDLNNLQTSVVKFLFISNTGYKELGIVGDKLKDQSFINGMQSKKDFLHDPEVKDWDLLYGVNDRIDAMIILASNNLFELQKMLIEYENKSLLKIGIKTIKIQKGQVLKNEAGLGIEHFGYVDGISQPIFIADEEKEFDVNTLWNDYADIKKLALVSDTDVSTNAFGSYFVFRKLEQNVKGFKDAEKGLGLDELGGAYVVGRFEDGTPVAKFGKEIGIKSDDELDNNFNYKNDKIGSKCPFHSHIRLTNPRDNKSQEKNPIRIVRRGIPYDDAGRGNNLDWQPEEKVGLLFMCYTSSIENQFEVIQGNWANNGVILDGKTIDKIVAIDGVIGQGAKHNHRLQEYPIKWGEDARLTNCNMSGFVTMQGGEYFFAPSIVFLKNL